jgi:hypothetical protein
MAIACSVTMARRPRSSASVRELAAQLIELMRQSICAGERSGHAPNDESSGSTCALKRRRVVAFAGNSTEALGVSMSLTQRAAERLRLRRIHHRQPRVRKGSSRDR